MYQAGLILEGGGMKGMYTAGVLDFFLDKGITFSSVYGVSAGACHMCSYLSAQRGRAKDVVLDYLDTRKYCSLESFLTSGNLFNVDMCYHLIPEYLNPYDYEAFSQYPGKAYSVATDIVTGKPEYFLIRDMKKDIDKIRASASLPLVSQNVRVKVKRSTVSSPDGKHAGGDTGYQYGYFLDGGLSDAIPIHKSIMDGNIKNIVVMTKEEGFIRKPASQTGFLKLRYLKYPKVYELMLERHINYNTTVDYLEEQKKSGRAFVIRPAKESKVGRIEKDRGKLERLYEEGYEDAERSFIRMKEYLE